MKKSTKSMLLAIIGGGLLFFAAGKAKAQSSQRVSFTKGASAASFRGVLKGQKQRYADYIVRAESGQTITVRLDRETQAEFVILQPETLENLSWGGKEWAGELPASGDYTIRVILNRNKARRGVTTAYAVRISIQ